VSEREDFLVDPYLLEEPAPGDWEVAARAVLAWGSKDMRQTARFFVSGECLTALMGADSCPYLSHARVGTALKAEGQSWITAIDVCRLVSQLLQGCHHIDVRVLCEGLKAEPTIVVDRVRQDALRATFPEWIVAVKANEAGEDQPRCKQLASRRGGGLEETTPWALSCRVESFEGPAEDVFATPADMSFVVQVLVEPPQPRFEVKDLLSDPVAAINRAYLLQVPASERHEHPLRPFSVGTNFVSSIREHCLDDNVEILGIILKQVVRLVSGQASRFASMEVHPQRTGPGAGDAVVGREDGAAQYRLTLTVHKQGYRLLFWRRGGWYELDEIRTESQ
jgi:hypothetical protein